MDELEKWASVVDILLKFSSFRFVRKREIGDIQIPIYCGVCSNFLKLSNLL